MIINKRQLSGQQLTLEKKKKNIFDLSGNSVLDETFFRKCEIIYGKSFIWSWKHDYSGNS